MKYQGWATDGWNRLLFETDRENLSLGDAVEYKGKKWTVTSLLKDLTEFAIKI